MPLDSLATTVQVTALQSQISALQAQLVAQSQQVVIGPTQPATTQQALAWIKTTNGYYDATYFYINNSWYTPLQYAIGQISLFRVGSALQVGWAAATDASLAPVSGFNWYEFTGTGLFINAGIAYRQFSQALISGVLA